MTAKRSCRCAEMKWKIFLAKYVKFVIGRVIGTKKNSLTKLAHLIVYLYIKHVNNGRKKRDNISWLI